MAVAMPSGPVSHGYCAMAAFADSSGPRCWTPRHCQDRDLLERGSSRRLPWPLTVAAAGLRLARIAAGLHEEQKIVWSLFGSRPRFGAALQGELHSARSNVTTVRR